MSHHLKVNRVLIGIGCYIQALYKVRASLGLLGSVMGMFRSTSRQLEPSSGLSTFATIRPRSRMWWSVSFLRSLVTGPLCTHQVFPELRDGNRAVFISLSKDIPSVVTIAGFECWVWYRQSSKAFTVHFTVLSQKIWQKINNDADLFTFPSKLMQK